MYSEKRPRDLIFTAAEQILAEARDAPIRVSRLAREIATRARGLGAEAGFDFSHWETAATAVVRAMLSAHALVSPDGDPIAPGVGALAAPVGSLRDGYRDRTESYLLEFLIGRLGDVTVRDHTALAHALFRQFDPSVSMADQEDRVAILLAGLSDRIELRGQTYRLRKEEHRLS